MCVVRDAALSDGNRTGTREDLTFGETSVPDHQPASAIITSMVMHGDERFDLRIDRGLKHPPGPLSDEFIQGTLLIKLSPKGDHLRIKLLVHWHDWSICLNLFHGVSRCPFRAAEGLKFQQDAPPFHSFKITTFDNISFWAALQWL